MPGANELDIRPERTRRPAPNEPNAGRERTRRPAPSEPTGRILGVDWDTKGAHWVVVDTIREWSGTHYATICDPWDTNVHIQEFKAGGPFRYDATTGGFMHDFWGTNMGKKYPYHGNGAKGQVKTWGMIYRDSAK